MKADELVDRVAEKVARMRDVQGVTSNGERLVVHLKDGDTVTFRVEVAS